MTCPRCQDSPIAFSEWMKGTNAFSTLCDNCGARLKGNATTWAGVIGTLTLVLAAIPASAPLLEAFGYGQADLTTRMMVVVPIVFAGGVLTWFLGGYDLVDPHPFFAEDQAEDAPRFVKRRELRSWIIILSALVILAIPVVIIFFGYADILLLPFGVEADATVVAATQQREFLGREGDWRIEYTFNAESREWKDSDVLPPAKMEPGLARVTIRYFRWWPSISRIDSQVSRTPVIALIMLIVFIVSYVRDERLPRGID